MRDLLALYAVVFLVCVLQGTFMFSKVEANSEASGAPSLQTDFKISESFTEGDRQKIQETATQHDFNADVSRLMGIIINSLYSNKEIFLRELISNASDALDKIRFLSLTDPTVLGEGETSKLSIKIKVDKEKKLLHVTDTGIGMTKNELVTNLGTIAKSGTKDWINKVQEGAEQGNTLIGQFGVGFYSVFLVADRVWVTSKNNEDKQWVWESTAENNFSIAEDPRGNTLGRGTTITLQLKEEHEDYLDVETLQNLAKKYSEFINFPIYVWKSHTEEEEIPQEPEEEKKEDSDEKLKVEDEEDKPKEEEKPKTRTITVWDWVLVNESKPIWTRAAKEVTDEEYKAFYKTISKDWKEPLDWSHFVGEGEVDFKSILYIPAEAPEGTYGEKDSKVRPIKLYVRRVFITDSFEDVMPKYLSFIRGVVDSDDLPLNVSREVFQKNKSLEVIKKKLVRKAIAMFQTLAEDKENPEKWEKFYEAYSQALKWGCIEDRLNRTRLSKLLRFRSNKVDGLTSFDDYVSRMKEGQKDIYYLAGDSKESLKNSPLVEKLEKKGFEVLFMVDPIDEYAIGGLEKFDGKYKFVNVGKEGLNLGDDKEKQKELEKEFQPLTTFLKSKFSSKIERVDISTRLTKSPSVLTASAWGWTAHMNKIVKAQALGGKRDPDMEPKKIWELNPLHPLIKQLNQKIIDNPSDEAIDSSAELLYDTASIMSGFEIPDPKKFVTQIHKYLSESFGIDPNAEVPDQPEEEETKPAPSTEEQEAKEEL